MLASGFDVPDDVCSMNISSKYENSMEQIELFIDENFADQDE